MKNCIVAQSGGPTAVINSSVIGVFYENLKVKYYDNVYSGLNGIEGILRGDIINLSQLEYDKLDTLKYTPSSALGSCRYKMEDYKKNHEDYTNLFNILKTLEIKTFFYVGGNDSMDTVAKLSDYAQKCGVDISFIGIPKTIDNDLCFTDHTPGYGSAAKFIATTALETYLDSSVYTNNGIFILETMGRDTGWLALAASLAIINDRMIADFIYLPEVAFNIDNFLSDVKEHFIANNQVYIVVSEGIKDKNGNFISESQTSHNHDNFGHNQLGGVGNVLKELIINAGITKRVKTLELGVMQRCAMHCASLTDLEEAHTVGRAAVSFSINGANGKMVGIKRVNETPYLYDTELVDVKLVANKIKYVPNQWINRNGNHVTKEAINYISPLIQGFPNLDIKNGLPKYIMVEKA